MGAYKERKFEIRKRIERAGYPIYTSVSSVLHARRNTLRASLFLLCEEESLLKALWSSPGGIGQTNDSFVGEQSARSSCLDGGNQGFSCLPVLKPVGRMKNESRRTNAANRQSEKRSEPRLSALLQFASKRRAERDFFAQFSIYEWKKINISIGESWYPYFQKENLQPDSTTLKSISSNEKNL